MKVKARKQTLLLCVLLGLFGCFHQIRKYTYPPEFTYIENKELANSMDSLANLVAALNRSLTINDQISSEAKQKLVVEILKQIELVGSKLGSSAGTNHPQIDHNISAFRNSLENARRTAQQTPPNYYLAGTITGSCSSCHLVR